MSAKTKKVSKNEKLLNFLEQTLQLLPMRITCFHARDYHQNLIGKITTEVKFAEQKSALLQKGFFLLQKGFLLQHTALLLPNLKNTLR